MSANVISSTTIDTVRLQNVLDVACRELLSRRNPQGHWSGRLSSSALSTATAVSALSVYRKSLPEHKDAAQINDLVQKALRWLVANQNSDGGFGDTDKSFSNISTTLLVKSALILSDNTSRELCSRMERADEYIESQGGIDAIKKRYGNDMTFSVPILTNAALAGLVPWQDVPQLPFERAVLPRSLFRLLKLSVVSYAIPALVAIGQVRFYVYSNQCKYLKIAWLHWLNPMTYLRRWAKRPTLKLIKTMQPESGGYLEAAPLTSFVAMSLIACDHAKHPIATKCVQFLLDTVREDGSWPIDTNLATWATSMAITALGHELGTVSPDLTIDWLLSCQHKKRHPFTGADPGGWGWTNLSGAVPDGDDTPAALLALERLLPTVENEKKRTQIFEAAEMGIHWLLKLQNSDGGMPTFCRGWGILPFDQSSTDLTAHAFRAFVAWQKHLMPITRKRALLHKMAQAQNRMLKFLEKQQHKDGFWLPLWFGNQYQPEEANPFYGTAKVLLALLDSPVSLSSTIDHRIQRGVAWLVAHQNADGGWGGDGKRSSVEETALVFEALAHYTRAKDRAPGLSAVYRRGLEWLLNAVESDRWTESSPIGLYFAKLWYYEELYPLLFLVSALRAALPEISATGQGRESCGKSLS